MATRHFQSSRVPTMPKPMVVLRRYPGWAATKSPWGYRNSCHPKRIKTQGRISEGEEPTGDEGKEFSTARPMNDGDETATPTIETNDRNSGQREDNPELVTAPTRTGIARIATGRCGVLELRGGGSTELGRSVLRRRGAGTRLASERSNEAGTVPSAEGGHAGIP